MIYFKHKETGHIYPYDKIIKLSKDHGVIGIVDQRIDIISKPQIYDAKEIPFHNDWEICETGINLSDEDFNVLHYNIPIGSETRDKINDHYWKKERLNYYLTNNN